MHISWNESNKHLVFLFNKKLTKHNKSVINFNKTVFGWDFNIGGLVVSYDNYKNVR